MKQLRKIPSLVWFVGERERKCEHIHLFLLLSTGYNICTTVTMVRNGSLILEFENLNDATLHTHTSTHIDGDDDKTLISTLNLSA